MCASLPVHPQSAPSTDPGRKGSKRWSRVFEDAIRNAKATTNNNNNNNNKSDGRALTERKKECNKERVHGEAAVEKY
jgi:hypothetical protein